MIKTKRAYEPASDDDGVRVLIDALWPRGVSKEKLRAVTWMREIAPSDALRKWYGHDEAKWPEFRARYRAELAAEGKRELVDELRRAARYGTLTLVYSAHSDKSNAAALAELLDEG